MASVTMRERRRVTNAATVAKTCWITSTRPSKPISVAIWPNAPDPLAMLAVIWSIRSLVRYRTISGNTLCRTASAVLIDSQRGVMLHTSRTARSVESARSVIFVTKDWMIDIGLSAQAADEARARFDDQAEGA